MKELNKAIIGLGSNIDPKRNIDAAREILKEQFTLLAESNFIQTKPVGYTNQDDFINGAVYIETPLEAPTLKEELKNIEKKLGRSSSTIKYGPRTIDLDIVVFNNQITDQDFYERDFLKNAVLELLPTLEY